MCWILQAECEDAPNYPQIARIWEHFKMLGNRILEKQ
jgi:hypothetical protein